MCFNKRGPSCSWSDQLGPHSITRLLEGLWSCQMRSGAPARPPCVAVSALRRGAPMHRLLLRARSRLPHSLDAGQGSYGPPSLCWRTCATSAGTSASAHPARAAPEPFQNARLLQLLAGLQYEASRGCGNAQVRACQQAQPAGQHARGPPQACCLGAGSRRGALLRVCSAARSRAARQFPARRLARAGGRHAARALTAIPPPPCQAAAPCCTPRLVPTELKEVCTGPAERRRLPRLQRTASRAARSAAAARTGSGGRAGAAAAAAGGGPCLLRGLACACWGARRASDGARPASTARCCASCQRCVCPAQQGAQRRTWHSARTAGSQRPLGSLARTQPGAGAGSAALAGV